MHGTRCKVTRFPSNIMSSHPQEINQHRQNMHRINKEKGAWNVLEVERAYLGNLSVKIPNYPKSTNKFSLT